MRNPVSVKALCIAAFGLLLLRCAASAIETNGLLDFRIIDATTEIRSSIVPLVATDSLSFRQRYDLTFTVPLYPNLHFLLGANFNRADTESQTLSLTSTTTSQRLRTFATLVYRTPIIISSVDLSRFDDRNSFNSGSSRSLTDKVSANLLWRPVDLPEWNLTLRHTNRYEPTRQTRDAVQDSVSLTGRYLWGRSFDFFLRSSYNRTENRLTDSGTDSLGHRGRVSFNRAILANRISFAARYEEDYRESRQLRSDQGGPQEPLLVPVDALVGLSINSDNLELVTLEPNQALNDGNVAIPAGINLGTVPPGGDRRARHLGLDFGLASTVDTVYVWIDRELPVQVVRQYRWEIYSSPDNFEWSLEAVVPFANFEIFENRFEIGFESVSARFLKVVTRPLPNASPGEEEFSNVLVTELGAFRAEAVGEGGSIVSRRRRYDINARVLLLPKHNLTYTLNHFGRKLNSDPVFYSLTNFLGYTRQLIPKVSFSARAGREDVRDPDLERTAYPLGVSFRAVWLPTFQQTLVLNTERNQTNGVDSSSQSVTLNTRMDLYEGVTANLNLTGAASDRPDRESTRGTVTGGMILIPHRTLTVNLNYDLTTLEERLTDLDEPVNISQQAGILSLTFRPVRAFFFFASLRRSVLDEQPPQIYRNFNIGVNPFPGGDLQINFSYDETVLPRSDFLQRTGGVFLRWNITDRWYADLTYSIDFNEQGLGERQTNGIAFSMRYLL